VAWPLAWATTRPAVLTDATPGVSLLNVAASVSVSRRSADVEARDRQILESIGRDEV